MKKLTKYEKEQLDAIEKWKKKEPGVVSKAFGFAIEPLAWLVKKVVPEKAIQGALAPGKMANGERQDHGR